MICPECARLKTKSTLHVGSGYTTLMSTNSFYDEGGRYHFHDSNSSRTKMRCSNGHELLEIKYRGCATCEWVGGETKIEIVKGEEQ